MSKHGTYQSLARGARQHQVRTAERLVEEAEKRRATVNATEVKEEVAMPETKNVEKSAKSNEKTAEKFDAEKAGQVVGHALKVGTEKASVIAAKAGQVTGTAVKTGWAFLSEFSVGLRRGLGK